MYLVKYHSSFAHQISQLFHQAVQHIDHAIYSKAQLDAWSFAPRSAQYWHNRLKHMYCLVMLHEDRCIGFIAMETHFKQQGYIAHLYIAPEFQGQGIATQLFESVLQYAQSLDYAQLIVDASSLSAPLFRLHGFIRQSRCYQLQRGQMLPALVMRKSLLV
ncbi:GNAT family N-acetyltransferase [Shewanella marina]|uniref:GNAT family N-acetyltransferase n=1 Tax=Shewanella marina TaxID=487319 RepID=UPI00047095C4|nr:GNAT family N-acetyltransferase [Shewanella marina]